jgi:hypothetical protein
LVDGPFSTDDESDSRGGHSLIITDVLPLSQIEKEMPCYAM